MTREHWAALPQAEKESLADHFEVLRARAEHLHPDEVLFLEELTVLERQVGGLRGPLTSKPASRRDIRCVLIFLR